MTLSRRAKNRRLTPLRKSLENVLGASPRPEHQMAVTNAMGKSSAFSHFVAKHLIQSVLRKGKVKLDFTTTHSAGKALASDKSALNSKDKQRVTMAIVHYYNQHPRSDWVQRATLLHALAGMKYHQTGNGKIFFRRVAGKDRHDFVRSTATKYLGEDTSGAHVKKK